MCASFTFFLYESLFRICQRASSVVLLVNIPSAGLALATLRRLLSCPLFLVVKTSLHDNSQTVNTCVQAHDHIFCGQPIFYRIWHRVTKIASASCTHAGTRSP